MIALVCPQSIAMDPIPGTERDPQIILIGVCVNGIYAASNKIKSDENRITNLLRLKEYIAFKIVGVKMMS
jgi:hypothetical protein